MDYRLTSSFLTAKAGRQYCPHSLTPLIRPWCSLGHKGPAQQELRQRMPACQTAILAAPPPRTPLRLPRPRSWASMQWHPLQPHLQSMHSMRVLASCQQSRHSRIRMVPAPQHVTLRALAACPLSGPRNPLTSYRGCQGATTLGLPLSIRATAASWAGVAALQDPPCLRGMPFRHPPMGLCQTALPPSRLGGSHHTVDLPPPGRSHHSCGLLRPPLPPTCLHFIPTAVLVGCLLQKLFSTLHLPCNQTLLRRQKDQGMTHSWSNSRTWLGLKPAGSFPGRGTSGSPTLVLQTSMVVAGARTGPLAHPVVAAALVLSPHMPVQLLR